MGLLLSTAVMAEGQAPIREEAPEEPELRTFLFTDVKRYRAFSSLQSDPARVELETRYAELVAERVQARGGRVLDVAGD